VALVSVVSTKFGPTLGGIVGAFPMVSGPVLLLFAFEQGPVFTTEAAYRTLFGTLSLVFYGAIYARVARLQKRHSSAVAALLAGYGGFILLTLLLEALPLPRATAFPVALGSILLGLRLIRAPEPSVSQIPTQRLSPTHHLGLRMAAAATLVLSLSEAASCLGPSYSGLLTPFPVAGTVLLVATHLEQGIDGMLIWLRGFILGLFGFITFATSIALLLVPCGVAKSFTIALVLAVAVQSGVTRKRLGIRWHVSQTAPLTQRRET
jgi:hypothetical protein